MFSRIGNLIYRSSESKNSGSYVNRQTLNLTLDPSGTDFVEYSTDSAYFTEAHSLIPNSESQITTTALKLQDSATNNLFLSTLGDFTLCVKHKLNASSTSSDIFSHYFANPQYDISFAEPYIRENSPFNVIVSKASDTSVEYEVSGNLIASDLSNGDISGTLSTVESVLPYTLNTGTGGNDFVFSLKNLDVSLNAPIYSQYYVTSSTNILGETVFAFSPTGTEGTYNNQLDLSFGANSKMIFDVADDTMTDISLVFGTTVDDSTSINETVVTRINDLVIVDISAGYTDGRLVYFEDTSAGMGYAKATATMTMTTTTLNPNTFNNVTNPTFYWDFREITNNTYVTDLINGTIKANAVGNLAFNSSTGPTFNSTDYIQIDPFTFGGKCSVEVYFKVTDFSSVWQRVVDFGGMFKIYSRFGGDTPYTIGVGLGTDLKGTTTINADTWYHVVVTVDASTNANVKVYLNANTGTPEISSSSIDFPNTNKKPYLVGKDIHGQTNQCMIGQIAYVRIWQDHVLTQSEITNLYSTKDYEVFVDVEVEVEVEPESYTVDVSNGVFRLDSGDGNGFEDKPAVTFNSGTTYVFDQSHDSNANNTLVIGTAPDISSSIVSSGLTIMGTPGQPGAYTKYVSDGSTVYYFSYQTENMGEEPLTYTVKVVDHEVTGEKVFSIQAPGTSTFINQPDLSFGAGDKYQFDVRDDTMADISLVFGTTVDDSTSINESVVTRTNGLVILDISAGYDGDRLVYFEDSSAGMGYVSSSSGSGSGSDAVINISFDTDGTNSGSYGSSGDMTITHDTIDTANSKYGNGALYINSSASGYAQSYIPTVFSSIPQDWCISFWMKSSEFTAANHAVCEMKTNGIQLYLGFNTASRFFPFTLKNDETGQYIIFDLPDGLDAFDNEYHHYFFKFEGQTLTTYIDGQIPSNGGITSITFERTLQGTTLTNFILGEIKTTNNPTTYYDDVRIFDKIVSIDEAKKEVIISSTENYTVDVSNGVFRLDSGDGNGFDEKPAIDFANNSGTTYVFDQSHASNANNTLVIGTAPDISSSIVSSGLTIMGTPGQPGAYTHYVSDGTPVYYFSYQTENMGEEPLTYTVKVVDHEVTGEKVFSIQAPGGTFINQPDLSFGAGDRYQFDVADNTMTDFSLVFGTTVDDSTSINESVVTRTNGLVILDISAGYDGDRLVYFEDSSAGMGYVSSSSSGTSGTAPQLLNNSFENNTLVGSTGSGTSINDWTTGPDDVYNRTFIIRDDDTSVFYLPTPFVNGSYCMGLEVNSNQNTGYLQQIITLPVNNYNLSWYDVRRSQGSGYDQPNNTAPIRIKITKEADSTVIHTHEYLVTNTTWTEKTTSFSITEKAIYIVTFETYFIDGNTGQAGFDKVTFSIAPPPVENYTVDVSNNSVFRLDSGDGNGFVEKLAINFNSNTAYIFDQSHVSNANNTLVIGTAPDISSSIVSSGLTIMGTPGQPGAYTKYVSDGSPVYYFSYQTEHMGEEPLTYTVKVVDHEVTGEKVFSIQAPGTSTFINQPDLSFGAGDRYQFDVRDNTMADISLVFGTTVDDSTSINESVVTRVSGYVILDISAGYDGDRLVYFEDSSAGMGYAKATATTTTTTTVMNPNIFNDVTNPTFYWDFREITNNTYVTDLINGIIKANAKGNLSFNSSTGPTFNSTDYIQIEPFTFGGKCSVEVYYKVTNYVVWQPVIDFGQGQENDNFYISSQYGAGGKFGFSMRDENLSISLEGTQTVNTDIWYHAIVTVDANSSPYINAYLNTVHVINNYASSVNNPNRERFSNLVGFNNWGSASMDGQIAYVRIWQDHVLTQTEITNLYNTKDLEVFADVEVEVEVEPDSYTVDVSNNSVFRLDSGSGFDEKPAIDFANNSGTTYIFDQSHESNANNTLVIGTTFDDPTSIVSSGLTIMGTPGQPGAYTKYVSDGSTVHYFSYQTSNMGYNPTP